MAAGQADFGETKTSRMGGALLDIVRQQVAECRTQCGSPRKRCLDLVPNLRVCRSECTAPRLLDVNNVGSALQRNLRLLRATYANQQCGHGWVSSQDWGFRSR